MAIAGERNRPVATAIPLKDMLRDKGPGVYLVVAERADLGQDEPSTPATNWVLVSNLGLTAYKGADGHGGRGALARPTPSRSPGSRCGSTRATTASSHRRTTDADGIAHIPGGLLHGSGGDEPFAVMAYGPDGDFNFLEIGRAAFDLSDRGVSGRPQPGPVDAFLYTDRGIYRPGETVHLTALVRDDKADAINGLPLACGCCGRTGSRSSNRQLTGDQLGAHHQSFALARDARIGTWRVELKVDPKAPPIGIAEFRVEDFVPPQLKVELSAADEPIRPGEPFPVDVAAHYYYGAPGAGLAVEAEAPIAFDDNPFPTEPRLPLRPGRRGIRRRPPRSRGAGDRRRRQGETGGRARRSARSDQAARGDDPGQRLRAERAGGHRDPDPADPPAPIWRSGCARRPATRRLPEGQPAKLDIIALDAAGQRASPPRGCAGNCCARAGNTTGIRSNGVWRHKVQVRDQPIEAGTLDVARRYAGDPGATAAGRALSLGGHRRRERRAVEPALPCRLVGRGGIARSCPTSSPRRSTRRATSRARPRSCSSRRRLPARPSWRSPPTGCSSLRSVTLPAEGATIEIPVDAAGAAASMRWSAPIARRTRRGRGSAGRGGRSGSPGSASTRRRAR